MIFLVWYIVALGLDELGRFVWWIRYSKNLEKILKTEIES